MESVLWAQQGQGAWKGDRWAANFCRSGCRVHVLWKMQVIYTKMPEAAWPRNTSGAPDPDIQPGRGRAEISMEHTIPSCWVSLQEPRSYPALPNTSCIQSDLPMLLCDDIPRVLEWKHIFIFNKLLKIIIYLFITSSPCVRGWASALTFIWENRIISWEFKGKRNEEGKEDDRNKGHKKDACCKMSLWWRPGV